MARLSDDELVARAVNDPDAFGEFYERHVDNVVRFFLRRVPEPELVSDLATETFAQMLASLERFDAARGGAVQFLYGIARHQYLMWMRKTEVSIRYRARLAMSLTLTWDGNIGNAEDRVWVEQTRSKLYEALGMLRLSERRAIELRVVGERPYPEVAEALGCSEGAARTRVSRGLAHLARLLEDPIDMDGNPS